MSCKKPCPHERHQLYVGAFDEKLETEFIWSISKYLTDPKISADDEDDLDLFYDLIFQSRFGRLHIHFYEYIFQKHYQSNAQHVVCAFSTYLDFIGRISV